ncbi:MAG: hypothetical protein CBB71_17980 [Rhodopirellula sp. TMED11]|nr:MAG: hypothetical protein CBB71_17980 [Rhodopirellula sp. TMED11]
MHMSQISTSRIRSWITLAMVLTLVVALATWWLKRDTVPRTIHFATGIAGGMYDLLGSSIVDSLAKRTESSVEVKNTNGSKENFDRLVGGEFDLAIVQGDPDRIEEISVITPLFREYLFVVARKGSGIETVGQLSGRKLCIGPKGSGSRAAALKMLEHFSISESTLGPEADLEFSELINDPSLEAAIVVAGIAHPELREVLLTNQFDLIPIQSAAALELDMPFIRRVEVPRGLFAEQPSVPQEACPTIATTAYLVCRENASTDLVEAALKAIHEENLRLKVPTLVSRAEAVGLTPTRFHPAAQRYFNPEDNLGEMVGVMESLVATKELLFALSAGIYLLWLRWRRMQEKELQEIVQRQKEHLDKLLTETLRIEKKQAETSNPEALRNYLKSVTRIKLQALQEFTEEELRGDQEFAILIEQCSSLINRIQLKLLSILFGQESA